MTHPHRGPRPRGVLSHNDGCAFCQEVRRIGALGLPVAEHDAAIDALFDLADRASRARRVYGRRKRGRW